VKALAVAGVELRRLLRWRANLFFLFVLPMLIILLLGAAFGGAEARLGVVASDTGPLGRELVASLEEKPQLEVRRFSDEAALERSVQSGRVGAGLVVPAGYDAALRSGDNAALSYFARPDAPAEKLRVAVESAVAGQSAEVRAARLLQRAGIATFEQGLARAGAAAVVMPPVEVRVTDPDGEPYPEGGGRFEAGASTQLVLFVFLTSLNGAIWLIEARRLGVMRRMLATPTRVRTVLAGETLGRFAIALLQAGIIVVGSAVAFGVGWGDPLAAAALVIAFSLVGSGAGLLLGSVVSSEQQAGPLALLLSLGLAALGGSMVPLEVFPDRVRAVAHLTPHAWANDGFAELVRHGGGIADVLPELGALFAFAAAVLALATWRLRSAILSAS